MDQSGLLVPGNIDLSNRPRVSNDDGSVSTVRSLGVNIDGREVLIPTVVGNRVVSDDEAIREYKRTGKHLGVFASPEASTAYAQKLHESEAAKLKSPMPQQTYSITAPNGKMLEVTGDHVPSESELHDIFQQAGVETGAEAQGSASLRFLSGAWKNLNPVTMVEGAVNAARHPIDTAGSIVQQNLGELSKAADNFKQGRYSEAAGHAAAGVLPVIGPAAAAAGERIGSGDVAGGLGEGAGLLAPFVAGPAMKAAGAGARGAVAAARAVPAGADALDAVAAMADRASTNRIVDVAGPKVGPNKMRLNNRLADVAPALARDPDLSALSRQGLQVKVASKLADATAVLDDAADSRLAARTFPTQPILDDLMAKRARLTSQAVEGSVVPPKTTSGVTLQAGEGQVVGARQPVSEPLGKDVVPAPNRARVAQIDQAISEVKQLGPMARYEPLRRIREAYDGPAKATYSPSMTADYLAKKGESLGAADVTGALRDSLAKMDPATADANAQYSLYKTANDVLQATEETERARPRVLRGIVARTGGAMVGAESGGVVGAGVGVLLGSVVERVAELAPTAKLVVARQLASVADLMRGGNVQQATATLRKIGSRLPAKVAGVAGQEASSGPSQVPQEPRAASR